MKRMEDEIEKNQFHKLFQIKKIAIKRMRPDLIGKKNER
jgi:hypothetical protein